MKTEHCWAFEAGSIQGFLFDTGRLADAVGASLLVDRLTGDLTDPTDVDDAADAQAGAVPRTPSSLLQCVLQASGAVGDAVDFSRRGGGSFIAFFADAAQRARTRCLWHAALASNAPGLRWSDAVADDPSAREAALAALQACQNAGRVDRARLPEAGPLVHRVARTGQPAAGLASVAGEPQALDAATIARQRHARRTGVAGTLLQRFSDAPGLVWPRNMEAAEDDGDDDGADASERFPFAGGSREVAFLHADGNGLGLLLRRLAEARDEAAYLSTYASFSRAVSRATVTAARAATEQVLLPAARDNADGSRTVPARPLILGGDDLGLIVRADLAVDYASAFLRSFERASASELQAVRVDGKPLQGLTAACGVAVVKSSFPFAQAAALAEHLCQRAKSEVKAEAARCGRALPLSSLALLRVTTSVPQDELPAVTLQARSWTLGCAAYVLEPAAGAPATDLPTLAQLLELADALGNQAMPRGPARRLLTDLHQDPATALERYRRWRENMRARKDTQVQLARIDDALQRLGVERADWMPLGEQHGSPWPDALLLRELGHATSTSMETAP